MHAAIYARKSTDQHGVSADQRSIARQIEQGRACARRKGWTVTDAHIYSDDGISGAEFAARPDFLRLMNALKPKPPFTVLVMSELSRLGREQIETAYALKQLSQAGVRVFSYLDDREVLLDSAIDKFMLAALTFGADLEQEKARQRSTDSSMRKAKAGHVTGGRVFGYDNVVITGADGKRSHVERRIHAAEAAVVRQIFRLSAEGVGQTRIAKTLNAERALTPRAQQGRRLAWSPSSVHEILFRDLYRGVITWNRTRKRNRWGQQQPTARPASEWITVPAPQLQIVSDAAWKAAHRRLDIARAQYEQDTHGRRHPQRDRDSKYLLPGFARCGLCRGGLHIRSRDHGRRRAFFYACTSHYNCGPDICPHVEQWPMEALDRAVLAAIAGDILKPDLVDDVIAAARTLSAASTRVAEADTRRRELAGVELEQARLTEAIAAGGDVPVLAARLRLTEMTRRELVAHVAASQRRSRPGWRDLERQIRQSLTDWRSLLAGDVTAARTGFRQLLTTPIVFTPFVEHGRRGIRFEGRIGLAAVFGTVVTELASPAGTGRPWYWPIQNRIQLAA